jgi:hypothetical protein
MNKTKLETIVDDIKNLDAAFKKFNSTMSGGPSSFYFEKIMGYYEGCMRASKFKEGDRVTLKEDYTGDASGWAHCKHFMKEDEPATVCDVDYCDGQYRYEIMFDNETWISSTDKKKRVVDRKHTFCFWQKELKRFK